MTGVVRGLSLRRLVLEPGRTLLLVLGVALGVAVLVAIRALNATAIRALERVESVQAGSASLEVESPSGSLPREDVEKARAVQGVAAATPVIARPAREARPGKRDATTRRVLVVGLDIADASARKAYDLASGAVKIDDPAIFAFAPNAALVTRGFAERRGLASGDAFWLYARQGRTPLVVGGTFEPSGAAAQALGGDVVIVPISVAESLFGPDGRVDRIEIALTADASREDVIARLRAALGPGADVHRAGERSVKTDALIGTTQLGLQLASLLALIIGMFLVYNAMSIAVVRRRPEIGVLRAVGATRAQVATLFFAESAAFGIVGAAGGIGLGVGLARIALGAVSAQMSQLYLPLDLRSVELGAVDVAIGMIAGPLATLVATVPPVISALRVTPVEAARKDLPRRDPLRAVNLLALLGAALLGAALVACVATPDGTGLFAGMAILLAIALGAAFLAPRGVVLVVGAARPSLASALGPTGALAGDNLLARPGRTGATVAALMVALGGVLAIAGLVRSLERGVEGWLARVLVADIYIAASAPLGSQSNTLIDASLADELKKIDGVTEAFPLRFSFVEAGGAPAMLIAIDMRFFSYRARFPEVEGDLALTLRDAKDGDCVAVSANFARKRRLGLGDRFPIVTPGGAIWTPRITLIVTDFSSDHGSLFVERPVFAEKFGDRRANAFDVFLRPNAPPEDVARVADEIRSRFGDSHDLFVTMQAPFRESVLGVLRSSFRITYAMQVVAIGVALLGVVTTLLAAILERTREIGVLRAIGATRGQIRLAVVTEAFLLGAIASGFGTTTGSALGAAIVRRVLPGVFGWELEFALPIRSLAFGIGAATLLAAVAGALPAARAARIRIVEALAYE